MIELQSEAPITMKFQAAALGLGLIDVAFFPDCSVFLPPLPDGYKELRVNEGEKAGTFYYNPRRITEERIAQRPLYKLLGHIQPKREAVSNFRAVVVQARINNVPVQDSLVDGSDQRLIRKQASVLLERYPGAEISVRNPIDVIEERKALIEEWEKE